MRTFILIGMAAVWLIGVVFALLYGRKHRKEIWKEQKPFICSSLDSLTRELEEMREEIEKL